MAAATRAAGGPEQRGLSEVQLKWTEFMWSLEKLRHNPYSKKTRERCVETSNRDAVFEAVLYYKFYARFSLLQ